MIEPVRVLAVGFGGIGTQDHQNTMYLPAISAHPDYELVGVVDFGITNDAKSVAERYHVPSYTDLHSAVRKSRATAACVTAPITSRSAAVVATLAAQCHVLVDKPMTPSSLAALHLAQIARDARLVLMPAHHQRMHPALQAVAAHLAAGVAGPTMSVTADFVVAGGDFAPGGELLNLGVYPIDVVQWLVSSPVIEVSALQTAPDDRALPYDLTALRLTHASGHVSAVRVGRISRNRDVRPGGPVSHRYSVVGTVANVEIDVLSPLIRIQRTNGDESIVARSGDTVRPLLDAFSTAVHSGVQTLHAIDAVRVLRIIEAAQASLLLGRPIPSNDP